MISASKRKECVMRNSQIRFIRQQGFPGMHFPHEFYSALMFQPRVVAGAAVLGVLLQSAWLFVALSAVLSWSAWLPSFNPFDAVYNRVVAYPRVLRPLGIAPAPRRFAQGMAGSVALAIAVALLAKAPAAAWTLEGVFVLASMAIVFGDSCFGACVYHVLRRTLRRSAQGNRSVAESMTC
jgi:hypothetical protein